MAQLLPTRQHDLVPGLVQLPSSKPRTLDGECGRISDEQLGRLRSRLRLFLDRRRQILCDSKQLLPEWGRADSEYEELLACARYLSWVARVLLTRRQAGIARG